MSYRVAVVGATGNVGREMLADPGGARVSRRGRDRGWPPTRSAGMEVSYGEDEILKVRELDGFDFKGIDIALFSPGAKVSAVHAPARRGGRLHRHRQHLAFPHGPRRAAGRAGGQSRGDRALHQAQHHRQPQLLDHPDGGGAQAACTIWRGSSAWSSPPTSRCRAPARRRWTSSSTRPAASSSMPRSSMSVSPSRSPSTCIPHIDVFMQDGSTKEEWKMVVETRKILDPDIAVSATCVRVPVFIGHAEAVNVEFETRSPSRRALRCAGRPASP